ncbi:MAG: hypothetical protein AAGB04_01585 [Pseudomonadota bacterium]
MVKGGWIGVDLDGTLAYYDHWRGADHIGEPIMPMVERVKNWLAAGKQVKIFTARMTEPYRDGIDVRNRIQDWCQEHGLPRLEVTNVKDYWMMEVWDDRAVQVIPNTGEPVRAEKVK